MRWLAIAVALITLVFVGAGCGGGGDEASTDTETIVATDTTETEETSTDETSTEETSTDTSGIDTDATFNWASEDCQGLVAAYLAITGAIGAAGAQGDVSGDVEQFTEYAEKVPEEIRDDVRVLAAAYAEYIDKLQGIGLESGEVPSASQLQQLQDASQSLGSSEVQAASDRLTAWTEENCAG
jgi:hypothetical protein